MSGGRAALRGSIPGHQAAQELQLYLRTMSVAQHRWERQIAQKENEVRRLMILEDSHRDRLRQCAFRHLNKRLQHLANTDLASAAALTVSLVSAPHLLQTCGVRSHQVTAFSMYALARLAADPDRIDTCTHADLTHVIADLQSGWEVVAPTKKAAYTELAGSVRSRLVGTPPPPSPSQPPSVETAHTTAVLTKPRRLQQRSHGLRAPRPPSHSATRTCGRRKCAQLPVPSHATHRTRTAHTLRLDGEPWEATAFRVFCEEAKQLFASALGVADVQSVAQAEWIPIAHAEWATKTVREKRLYYTQTLQQ